ncbi:Transposase TnpB protein [Alloalcanivorax dieselolei B5]|uniref:Transposase TnpB protein n=1 Tax=Alcanivorax dieselolei (strain DSM 16502 / CGMCC 1.3690 / MCCC 1A00001 / B-5) TaxID=930169 RepID=K0CJK0_ALCDB|nr:IS66 family insertion sequence element accessory protein TnpB [Alloalcanivorax dieselolei]AFT71927.1 Transposase TnpB protein [Alloalcanivorax dieselolei B5]GGK08670.1 hypothetical protein GCM10007426_41250 [Alloalcanivorax dieselolei]
MNKLVEEKAGESTQTPNPLRDGVFIFRNKSGDKVKLMYWQRNGLMVSYKRLKQGRFKWPKASADSLSLPRQDLELLLDGIDLNKLKRVCRGRLRKNRC